MIMQTTPEPSIDEGKHVHKELRDLLETIVVQQAQSSTERWHPKASLMHISSTHGALEEYHAPSILRHGDDVVALRWEPSPAHSRYVKNHNAHPVQGDRHPGQDPAGMDLPYYGDSDLDNHG